MMRSDEKQKLIDQSLVNCHLNAEAPRDRGEVKLYELSKAASKVAAELAEFETPWFQSLRLMVEAAGVQLDQDDIVPTNRQIMRHELPDNLLAKIPRRLRRIPTERKPGIEYGHTGHECFKLFSRTRLHDSVGFAFLVRQIPITSHLTNPYQLVSVEDIGQSSEFWLFSSHGVLYTNGPYSEFCTLVQWARAAELYEKARQNRFYREFKLKKYFAFWSERTRRAKYEKRRKQFQTRFLLAEVELAQPILAVSALIDELDNMQLLPKLTATNWSHAHFKSASSATHLSLAVMIENLFKLGAVITSGTLGRLDRAMEESRQQVAKLDRAPKSTRESWHHLRQELKAAQRQHRRYGQALDSSWNMLEHCYYRMASVVLGVYRNQFKYVWNRINSSPVLIMSLAIDANQMCLSPSVQDWSSSILTHLNDLASSVGLALQRAQHRISEQIIATDGRDSNILEKFERRLFKLLQSDIEARTLHAQIEAKITHDLNATKEHWGAKK